MALKIQNQDVADERGLINSDFNPYQTVPTSISQQNFWTSSNPEQSRVGGGTGTLWQDRGVKIADGMLYVAAPRWGDLGRMFIWNIKRDLIPQLSGSNFRIGSPTVSVRNQNGNTSHDEMFTVWDAGHGLLATVKRIGNPSGQSDGVLRVFRIVATYGGSNSTGPMPSNPPSGSPVYDGEIDSNADEVWTKTFSDSTYSLHTSIRAIAIGNGRVYVAWRGEKSEIGDNTFRWHFTILDLEGNQISDTILATGSTYSTLICDMDANHGYVLLAQYEDDALLYTADGKYLDALEGSSFRCRINCNRFVVTQKDTATRYKIWDYARKNIVNAYDGSNGADGPYSVDVGEELMIVGRPHGDPTTGVGTVSNGGEFQVFDLDGDSREDYGQSGDFWAFGLVSSNDEWGSSVAIGDGIMVVGGAEYMNNDSTYNNTNGVANSYRTGGILVYKIPTTLSNYYERIIQNYRY